MELENAFLATKVLNATEPTLERTALKGTRYKLVAFFCGLAAAVSEPFAELPPTLAAHVAIIDGDMMRISSRRASVALRARVTESIRAELIFAPFYWGEGGSINDVIGCTLASHSKMPPFKACAVNDRTVVPSS